MNTTSQPTRVDPKPTGPEADRILVETTAQSADWPVYLAWRKEHDPVPVGQFVAVCDGVAEGPHPSVADLQEAAFKRFGRKRMRFYKIGAERLPAFDTF